MRAWAELLERDRGWVLARLHVLRREATDRAWHSLTTGNDSAQCLAELDALESAIGLLESVPT